MARLPTPLRQTLREISPSEHELARVFSKVLLRSERPRPTLRIVALAAATACALLLVAGSVHRGNPLRPPVHADDAGPLYLADRHPIGVLVNEAAAGKAQAVALSDGSQIELGPGTRLDLLENSGQRFEVLLPRGRAEFQVHPGGPRRWIIEGGLAAVEVVGTQFSVERQSGRLEVRVSHGIVLVHGELVPGRVQRLRAGAVLTVTENALPPREPVRTSAHQVAPPPDQTTTVTPAAPPIAPKAAPRGVTPKSQALPPAPAWRALAQEHDYHQAWKALGDEGIKKQLTLALSLDELLTLSDVARLSGHPRDALPLLEQAIAHFPTDQRVALLAFTRGRIFFDDLHQPAQAAQAFTHALTLGLPRALSEDAYALLVEARARAADPQGAREAAKEYDARFPHGRHHERILRWVTTP